MNAKLSFPLGSPQLQKVEGLGLGRASKGIQKCPNKSCTCQLLRLSSAWIEVSAGQRGWHGPVAEHYA